MSAVIAVSLLVVFVLTVLVQVRDARFQWLRRVDSLGLLPAWWFFAPDPAKGDYILLIRDRLDDDACTSWSEVHVAADRDWRAFLWNPDRRLRKALFDIVTALLNHVKDLSAGQIQTSIPYLLLLNYVSNLDVLSSGVARQFAIALTDETPEGAEPLVVFASAWHGLR